MILLAQLQGYLCIVVRKGDYSIAENISCLSLTEFELDLLAFIHHYQLSFC
jgi:hypothetical protein